MLVKYILYDMLKVKLLNTNGQQMKKPDKSTHGVVFYTSVPRVNNMWKYFHVNHYNMF